MTQDNHLVRHGLIGRRSFIAACALAAGGLTAIPTQASMEASSAAVRTAMAAGPPVMVTPLPLFDDVGQAVARSPGTAPDALAAGLESLLADPAARARIQAHAQAWMQANAWPAIAARTQGALLGLLAAAMPRQRDKP